MAKSKAKEVMPRGTVHLVKWVQTNTTRGVQGRWVSEKCKNTGRSAQSSPTKSPMKSPTKQPSDKTTYRFSEDFDASYDDQGINRVQLPNRRGKKKQCPNEYLRQWKYRTHDYLDIMLQGEVPPPDRPIFCTKCCRAEHSLRPFHWISQWNRDFFERTTLTKLGVEIHAGHRGKPCPHHDWEWEDMDDEGQYAPGLGEDAPSAEVLWGVPEAYDGEPDVFVELGSAAAAQDSLEVNILPAGKTAITVVHTSGVHTMSIRFCRCPDAETLDKQLFKMGLFLASFTRPKTAFTFALLDNFILDNLECRTSAMNYYSKLKRITSSMFPHLVPDQYWELMRVARQWRQLKLLKWNGFCHERRDLKDGELALFCPACPQPGINVAVPTKDDPSPKWLYTRSLVMDGNFKAEHLHPTHPEDKVWLTDGQCFMVARARYQAHLAISKDSAQRSECNNHRAVNQANASRHKLETTGIGGCACARHGCFVPNSMVDFQKGERQMNMDYTLCNALSYNTDGLCQAFMFYDVNCQYNKHLRRRVDESLHLTIPSGMEIIPGIGLWHVHGHQDKCFAQYTSNFIPGAARIDGEIMETLWVPLNIILPSARGMSTPHRQECLDYEMNDWLFLSRKYKEAKQGVRESTEAFEKLNNTADPAMVQRWEAEENEAQACRMTDPSAMDIYDVRLRKAPRSGERSQLGAVTWLACGITIEEMQIALAMEIRRAGKHQTETQTLEIGRRQVRLQHSIDEFIAGVARYLGKEYDGDDCITDMDMDFLEDGLDSDCSSDDVPDSGGHQPQVLFRPEIAGIPLPSNLGLERCEELGVVGLVRKEITLRDGQANDMLHVIRVHLADKAVLFRTTVRLAKSQATTT
ncbi:hypothetical protein F4604DRAFT_1927293 [Suillus subluteus]|nr:hypothetical protein F4604DRAFT_1927293 [Suillus subluteus]